MWREVHLNGLNGKCTSKWQVAEGGEVARGCHLRYPRTSIHTIINMSLGSLEEILRLEVWSG